MKTIRQLHLYLGCFFAPLILYYSLSGAWQVFRFNDLPRLKTETSRAENAPRESALTSEESVSPSSLRSLFHELSQPHLHASAPGRNPKTSQSRFFKGLSALMGLSLASTTLLGIALAFGYKRSRAKVLGSLIAGTLLPLLALLM